MSKSRRWTRPMVSLHRAIISRNLQTWPRRCGLPRRRPSSSQLTTGRRPLWVYLSRAAAAAAVIAAVAWAGYSYWHASPPSTVVQGNAPQPNVLQSRAPLRSNPSPPTTDSAAPAGARGAETFLCRHCRTTARCNPRQRRAKPCIHTRAHHSSARGTCTAAAGCVRYKNCCPAEGVRARCSAR